MADFEKIVENYDSILADRMDNRGISFGFPGMDKAGGRMRPGNVSIIAAPPGMGKTEIAISITKSAAYSQKKSVLFFSLEMMDVELADRIIAEDANISGELLDNPLMIDKDWERTDQIGPDMAKIGTALERIRDKGSQIYVHEEPNVSHQRIGSVIEKMQKRDGALGLVIIDYIQLVTAPGAKSRFDEVAKVSREIKALAKRHKVPILCLAQLNREAVKAWATREPMNSDLRECGQLEQDADKICFLYGPESRDTTSPNCGLVMPIFTKRRGGPAGRAVLEFIGGHYRDTDRSLVVEDEESSGGDWR